MWVTRHFRVPLTFMVLLSVLWKLNGPRAKERNAKTQEATKDMPTFCRRYFEECWQPNNVSQWLFLFILWKSVGPKWFDTNILQNNLLFWRMKLFGYQILQNILFCVPQKKGITTFYRYIQIQYTLMNVGNQTVLCPIDFHCTFLPYYGSQWKCCLSRYPLLCSRGKKHCI